MMVRACLYVDRHEQSGGQRASFDAIGARVSSSKPVISVDQNDPINYIKI